MKQISEGLWKDKGSILTPNLVPGTKVYGEQLIKSSGKEFRVWDPSRSKLGAAITNGLKAMPFKAGSIVLYLGAASGTTISHISDIIGRNGLIYAVEFSERPFRSLQDVSQSRMNIAPILADARKPETYAWVECADIIFVDLAQPDETEISIRNAGIFLKSDGYLMIAVKSQSIDVTKEPQKVYSEEAKKLESAGYTIVEIVNLEPHETAHALIVAQKQPACRTR
jgi:fibrillarin-like pre-rRNA processing protein